MISQNQTKANATGGQLAKIGAIHGYRFDGDSVSLNAMFTVIDPEAHDRAWALQLWACPSAPQSAAEISGHLVSELVLPPIGEVADETESFEMTGPAFAPAGQAEHVMVLALVSNERGASERIHDYVVYPRTESFCQPRLNGSVGFSVQGNRVTLTVERIENPRESFNWSGTLALELWALPEVYKGGEFGGFPLAGVSFDPLQGKHEYRNRSFDLPYVEPPAGNWNVVLMLREWTVNGYVTRDFTNFNFPMMTAPSEAHAASVTPKAEGKSVGSTVVIASQPAAKQGRARRSTKNVADSVSVNTASRDELVSVKGLSTKIVEGILSKRPFKSLEELKNIKGVGVKLFEKLKSSLKL